jgi:hypothetical protein
VIVNSNTTRGRHGRRTADLARSSRRNSSGIRTEHNVRVEDREKRGKVSATDATRKVSLLSPKDVGGAGWSGS